MALFQVNYEDARKSPAMAAPQAFQQTGALLQEMQQRSQMMDLREQEFALAEQEAAAVADRFQQRSAQDGRALDLREQVQTFEIEQQRQGNRLMYAELAAKEPAFYEYLKRNDVLGPDAPDMSVGNPGVQLLHQDLRGQFQMEQAQKSHEKMRAWGKEVGVDLDALVAAGGPDGEPADVGAIYKDIQTRKQAHDEQARLDGRRNEVVTRWRSELDLGGKGLSRERRKEIDNMIRRAEYDGTLTSEEIEEIDEALLEELDLEAVHARRENVEAENDQLKQALIEMAGERFVAGQEAMWRSTEASPLRGPADEALERHNFAQAGAQRTPKEGLPSFDAWAGNNAAPVPLAGLGPGAASRKPTTGSVGKREEAFGKLADVFKKHGFGPENPVPEQRDGAFGQDGVRLMNDLVDAAEGLGFAFDDAAYLSVLEWMKEGRK